MKNTHLSRDLTCVHSITVCPVSCPLCPLCPLSCAVLQRHTDARLTYISAHICAVRGSTVDIRCSYRRPSSPRRRPLPPEQTLWFNDLQDGGPVDLRTQPQYAGRVKYYCDRTTCTLRMSELRRSDSAEYKFKFKHKPNRKFIKLPGVSLSVSGNVHLCLCVSVCLCRFSLNTHFLSPAVRSRRPGGGEAVVLILGRPALPQQLRPASPSVLRLVQERTEAPGPDVFVLRGLL